nr:hypothetical protein [Clostridioides sp.]
MIKKERKHYYLTDSSIKYIDQYKKEYNCKNSSVALEKIINDHKEKIHINKEDFFNIVTEKLTLDIKEFLKNELKKTRVVENKLDIELKTILELFNGLLILKGIEELTSTEDLESKALNKARKIVNDKKFKEIYKNKGDLF